MYFYLPTPELQQHRVVKDIAHVQTRDKVVHTPFPHRVVHMHMCHKLRTCYTPKKVVKVVTWTAYNERPTKREFVGKNTCYKGFHHGIKKVVEPAFLAYCRKEGERVLCLAVTKWQLQDAPVQFVKRRRFRPSHLVALVRHYELQPLNTFLRELK